METFIELFKYLYDTKEWVQLAVLILVFATVSSAIGSMIILLGGNAWYVLHRRRRRY